MPGPETLSFANQLFHRLPGASKEQKVFWANIIRVTYSDSLTESEIQFYESVAATRPHQNVDELIQTLDDGELVFVIALFHLLIKHTTPTTESNEQSRIELLDKLRKRFKGSENEIESQVRALEQMLARNASKFHMKIPGRIWPLVLDFAIRSLLLLLIVPGDEQSVNGVLFLNIFAVPPLTLLITYLVGKADRKYHEKLFEPAGGFQQFRIDYRLTSFQYTILAFLFANAVYIVSVLYPASVAMATLVFLLLYYFTYVRFYCVGRISYGAFTEQLRESRREKAALDVDSNDEALVNLETRLTSTTSRLEAYVLESALFGALSFSGFLQIISDNQVSFQTLEAFATEIRLATEAVILGDGEAYFTAIQHLSTKENLFCLVSVESLLCSIFFLGVIASRLQFSNIADRAQAALNRAKVYNEKEEALMESPEANRERLRTITIRVNEYIREGEATMDEVAPVTAFMQYFRNAGLLTFLLILITSSFFITSGLAIGFFMLSILSWAYFNRKHLQTDVSYFLQELRFYFMRYRVLLFSMSFGLMTLALILRVQFDVSNTSWIFSAGFITLCLFIIVWLIFIPHVDPFFGAIDRSGNSWSDGRWNLVKVTAGIFIPHFLNSILMKANGMPGSDENLLVSLSILAALMYFMAGYLSRPRWIGIFPAAVLATSIIGVLFKILHMYGADEMMQIGMIGIVIAVPVMFYYRKKFHKLFLRLFFIILAMITITGTGWFYRVHLMYEHHSWTVRRIEGTLNDVRYSRVPGQARGEWMDNVLAHSDWYLDEFHNKYGMTRLHRTMLMSFTAIAENTLSKAADSVDLNVALEVSKRIGRVVRLFEGEVLDYTDDEVLSFLTLEPRVLAKMNRYEEALTALKSAREMRQDIRHLDDRLKELELALLNSATEKVVGN